MDERDPRRINREAYNKLADWWQDVAEHVDGRVWIERPAMRRLVGRLSGERVLALGCGSGRELEWLLEQGAGSLVGVDASVAQLRLARERVGDRAQFVCADVESWKIPAAAFDLMVCSLLLHHIVDLDATLRSLRGGLREGGRVIFSYPHGATFGAQHNEDWTKRMLGHDSREGQEQVIFGDYLNEQEIVLGLGPSGEELRVRKRSPEQILTAVLAAGLTITAVKAPPAPVPAPEDPPKLRDFKTLWACHPCFLIVEATRISRD